MKSKTGKKKKQDQLLFQASCYGSAILCQTQDCATLPKRNSPQPAS